MFSVQSGGTYNAYTIGNAQYNNGVTAIAGTTEIYQDYNSMNVRTRHQDAEILKLKEEIKEKQVDKKMKLESLIAYYYKK